VSLADQLERWRQAGIIDAVQAERIRALEAGSESPPAPPQGLQVTAIEVVAYAGAVVLLVGTGFLVGIQYTQLGVPGRLLIFGLLAAAGLALGLFMESRSDRPAARRARSAGFLLGVLLTFVFAAEAFYDGHVLRTGDDGSGSVMLGAAVGLLLGAWLLWRTGAALVAVAAGACLLIGTGAFESVTHASPDAQAELPWVVAGAILAAGAEVVARRRPGVAAELLRAAAVFALVISCLVISSQVG